MQEACSTGRNLSLKLHSGIPIWAPFSWTQRMLKVEVCWRSGTSVKEQSSHDLDIRLWGTKGLFKRRTCIGTGRARIHLLFHSIQRAVAH
jgi:hypothetical protein